MTRLWSKGGLAVAFILAGAPLAMAAPARMPAPGLLNSVQGEVSFDGHPAPERPVALPSETRGGPEVVETQRGKAELLLTPGSFLRIGDDSEAQIVSRSLENTAVQVVKGTALLDARANFKHDLTVLMDGTRTRIEKKGLYGFDANRRTISVLRGKASVYEEDSRVTLKDKRQLDIASQTPPEIRRLNVRAFKSGALYRWNQMRSRYESKARKSVQEAIAQSGHWYGPGWYWARFWGFYTYLHSVGSAYYYGPYYRPYYGPAWNGWVWGPGWGWGPAWGWGPGWGWRRGWDDDD